MRRLGFSPLWLIAVMVCLSGLLGYFIDWAPLLTLNRRLLHWGLALSGVAILLGFINLVRVHWLKIQNATKSWFYSAILLVSMLGTLLIGFTNEAWLNWTFNHLIIPVESSLLAILAIVLVLGAARLFGGRLNLLSVVFLCTALLILLGIAVLPAVEMPALHSLRDWLLNVPVAGGGRGLLLGIALGAIISGLRILSGSERPYER